LSPPSIAPSAIRRLTALANAALVEHPKNSDQALAYAVRDKIRGSRNHELAGARHATETPPLRKLGERLDGVEDAMRNGFGTTGGIPGDVGAEILEIVERQGVPYDPHRGRGSSLSVPQLRSQDATLGCSTGEAPASATSTA
jgi:hypothetical protein